VDEGAFETSVFVNCPFDSNYAPLLEAALFCIVSLGFVPYLANARLEAGENRLDKIVEMIRRSKYSLHDLSRAKAASSGDLFRMNMPFEFGIDVGLRRSGVAPLDRKKFLIFESRPFELKAALSDVAGQDVAHHNQDYELVLSEVRDFLRVEAGVYAPGPARLLSQYVSFLGWMTDKKIFEGHSEEQAKKLPTRERLDEMEAWIALGRPPEFHRH
jgi:hypothetical protein